MTRSSEDDEERRARSGRKDGRRRLQRAAEELQLSVCVSRTLHTPTSVAPVAARELADVSRETRVDPERVETLKCATRAQSERGTVQRGESGAEVQLRVEGAQRLDEDACVVGANDHFGGRRNGILLEETLDAACEERKSVTAAPAW